ncbi:MAG: helix-turn-helix domain-containing protein [Ktedonobacteraceae bacterium]|nr:helix-turn-helix domain-containing protein [Ktedonobacteraceae bacterium]
MSFLPGNQRFLANTRGRIVALLRRASRTVEDLAQALGLTDNAVRAQLATLERDGLVQPSGRRRSSSKPALVYDLTPAAQELFARAYAPVLQYLLDTLNERMTPGEVEEMLCTVGRRLAAQWPVPQGELSTRLEAAVAMLNGLGGLAELEQGDDAYVIRGYSCPLAAVVPGHPEVCRLARSLLAELVGVPVQERCERDGKASCRFFVSAPAVE